MRSASNACPPCLDCFHKTPSLFGSISTMRVATAYLVLYNTALTAGWAACLYTAVSAMAKCDGCLDGVFEATYPILGEAQVLKGAARSSFTLRCIDRQHAASQPRPLSSLLRLSRSQLKWRSARPAQERSRRCRCWRRRTRRLVRQGGMTTNGRCFLRVASTGMTCTMHAACSSFSALCVCC